MISQPLQLCTACREEEVIVLRPPTFQEHSAQFIIKYTPTTAAGTLQTQAGQTISLTQTADCPAAYTCWRVPHHLRTATHWQQLLTGHAAAMCAQQLVLLQPDSHIVHVLSKFEQPQFIHAYVPGDHNQQLQPQPLAAGSSLHLPRFDLEFELQPDGRIFSKDFRQYVLADRQQLVAPTAPPKTTTDQPCDVQYKLPGFSQYLVLTLMTTNSSCNSATRTAADVTGLTCSSTLVLMPIGQVQRNVAGSCAGCAVEQIKIKRSNDTSRTELKVSNL
eukprot:gene15340-biopygen15855